jgi:hypothetical protein
MPLLPKLQTWLDEGVHWTVTFLDDGRYLHTGRAAAREV